MCLKYRLEWCAGLTQVVQGSFNSWQRDGYKQGKERLLIVRLLILRKMLPTAWGRALEKFALPSSALMRILLAKVLLKIAFASFVWVSVSILQRHRTNGVIFIKKFGRMIVDFLENQGSVAVQLFMSAGHLLAKFPPCWGEVSLVLVRASTDRMRPAYIMDGSLLLLNVPWFKC